MITYKTDDNKNKVYLIHHKDEDGNPTKKEVSSNVLSLSFIMVLCFAVGLGIFQIGFLAAQKHFIILALISGYISWIAFQPDEATNKISWSVAVKSFLTSIPLTAFAISQLVRYNEALQQLMLSKFYFFYIVITIGFFLGETIKTYMTMKEEK